jgi:hypothetical protein
LDSQIKLNIVIKGLNMKLNHSISSIVFIILTLTVFTSCDSPPVELTIHDFKFDGPLGSEGAKIEKIAKNHFRVSLGHAPEHPNWANMLQFQITGNAKGNTLRLDVEFHHATPHYHFNEYFNSWSYDLEEWQPVQWKRYQHSIRSSDVMIFPKFEEDIVYVGHQVPMSYDMVEEFLNEWKKSPYATVNLLGQSLLGKNLYRLTLADTTRSGDKWVHYFSNQHPGEHNSQWRMVGMINWLLGEEGIGYLRENIHHFVLMMSPDAPERGWYRVNAQGVDMNRSYSGKGSDKKIQAHEAYVFQKDLEDMMDSDHPVNNLWCMHTWGGAVESIMLTGPEIGSGLGKYTELRDIIIKNDPNLLIEPLRLNQTNQSLDNRWNHGPYLQFGITNVLCEGSGNFYTKEENWESGEILMKSIAEYYR